MTVLVANDTPPAVRGILKRWFLEPRPNVFVGTLNARTAENVLAYVMRHVPPDFGVLVIQSAANCQGYTVRRIGQDGFRGRRPVEISGIPLLAEEWIDEDRLPF